ncbi:MULTISPECIES: tyrosine-type recombinase/integrase [unclassified Bradyrhizobium]|uniref:tyrosine-type recombinase/integrase n=1 Tax=unclassified Bradyrhizobium TaxID=2631580 RepID=UPI00230588E2|nr:MULTISPECIES: site-specific integrase [unclassified Bradyrhizobium]MDA9415140.1 integrase [Bradyrhizobium sp. CCBAU 25360]MDA9448742.1 integrase [Bradyrhizobium sp. CCBAU 21360]MDA9454048.1 integrase [Bradyrhizobium sp. CCBAU 21359]
MGLGKQAKTLSKGQAEATLAYLSTTRYPERNRLIFLLSAKAGLRAKEIARLTWRMVYDAAGQVGHAVHLTNDASKGTSGRVIPMHPEVRAALIAYRQTMTRTPGDYVIGTERMSSTSPQAIVNMFQRWYQHLGFVGCSSHSGRRTFITGAARKISTVGGSLRDVQALAGHSNLRTTQQYIEQDVDAQRKVIQQL